MSDNLGEIKDDDLNDGIVTMYDELGESADFQYLDEIEYLGDTYAVFLPVEEDDNSLVILKILPSPDNDDEIQYVGVDDQDILNDVFELFKEKNIDEFDFE